MPRSKLFSRSAARGTGPDIVSVPRLGGLSAIEKFCGLSRLAEVIDEALPAAKQARLSHGQTFVALAMKQEGRVSCSAAHIQLAVFLVGGPGVLEHFQIKRRFARLMAHANVGFQIGGRVVPCVPTQGSAAPSFV